MTGDVPSGGGFRNIRQANPRRALLLCGLGAIAGLLIAGVGLFSARGTRTFVVPPEDAATVNNVPILMSDLIGQLRTLYDVSLQQATPSQTHKVLGDMIREELYVQRGVELGLPTDDTDVRAALVAATEASVGQDALASRPSDAELRAWYDAHRDRYSSEGTMALRDLVALPTGVPIDQVVAALRRGESPAALGLKDAAKMDNSDQFYFAAKLHLGDPLFALARGMRDGEIAGAAVQPGGAHILIMARNRPPIPTQYGDARDRVLHDFLDAKVARLQGGNERFLRKRADIKIAPALR